MCQIKISVAVPVGKVDIAMSAFLTMDVDMGHAKFHGSASVMKAGEAFSVIRVSMHYLMDLSHKSAS